MEWKSPQQTAVSGLTRFVAWTPTQPTQGTLVVRQKGVDHPASYEIESIKEAPSGGYFVTWLIDGETYPFGTHLVLATIDGESLPDLLIVNYT